MKKQDLQTFFKGICSKQRTVIRITIACSILFCCFLFTGCKKKNHTSSEYGYITFTFNVDSLFGKEIGKETLRFCFYPSDKGPMIQTESDSGVLKMALPPDTYSLLVYNSDQHSIQFRKRSNLEDTEAYFVEDEMNGSKINSISPLYGVVLNDLKIEPGQDVTMALTPSYFTKRVCFFINIDPSVQSSIADCSGTLNGVGTSLHISDRIVNRKATTELPFLLNKTEYGLRGGVFLLNGEAESASTEDISHHLTLSFIMKDGRKITSSLEMGSVLFDIKEQNIYVNISATLTDSPEKKIILSCESVTTNPEKTKI